jgi:predicted Co/Zn/Cd cation transporter (cation efflux family)
MILLDGAYAVIGIGLSVLLLRASSLARSAPTHRYQYGREPATPLAIGIQGLVLLGTLLYAAFAAVATIREGGSVVAPGAAVLYSVIVTASGLVVWIWLRNAAAGSDLVGAEVAAWRVSALRGVGMIAGFSLMWALTRSRWDGVVPYVDPCMVLSTCLVFLPTPLRMVRATVLELLGGAPSRTVQESVRDAVSEIERRYRLGAATIRTAKVGPKLYVELEAAASLELTIATAHEARQRLLRLLEPLPFEIWLTLELMPNLAVSEDRP